MNKRIPFITLLIILGLLINLSGQNAESLLKETKEGLRILEYSKKAIALSQDQDSSFNQYFSKALFIADSLNDDLYLSIIYLNLGDGYKNYKDYSKSAESYKKSIELAEKLNQNEIKSEGYYSLADILSLSLNYDSAYTLLQKSLEFAEDHQLPLIYTKIGDNLNTRGKNPEAVEMYINAANIYIELGDSSNLATVYNDIGAIFLLSKREIKAVEYFKRALNYIKSDNITRLLTIYGNLGVAYKDLDSLSLAEDFYNKTLDIARNTNNEFQLARNYYNLGVLKVKEGKFSIAANYYDSTEYYCHKNNINYGLMILEISRSNLFLEMGQVQKAIQLGKSAMFKLENYNLPYENSELFDILYKAYKRLGNSKEALFFHEKSVALKDSLSDIETLKIIEGYENLYEKEKSAKQIIDLENDVLKAQSHKRFIIFGLIGLLLLVIIFGILFYSTKKRAKIFSQMEREKFDHLKEKMVSKSRESTSKALLIAHLNENLDKINNKIREFLPDANKQLAKFLLDLIEMVQSSKSNNAWDEFEDNLSQVNEDLYKKLLHISSDLTPTELKVCGMIAQNLNTKDIALLTNRSRQTIDNIRYTLRKKLDLDQDDNLTSFIISL